MNDPNRWNREPAGHPIAADVLLRGVRRPRPPGADDLARLESVVAQIPRRSALAARRRARFVTATAAALVVASLGTAVWALRGRREPNREIAGAIVAAEPLRSSKPVREPISPERTAVAPGEAPTTNPAERRAVIRRRGSGPSVARRARAAPATPAAARETDVDTLTREIALVDAARADVDAAPSRALAALDLHRREFPRGQLAAEREFLAVEALRRSDRTDEARRRADELQVSYPSSSYAARASRLLRSAP